MKYVALLTNTAEDRERWETMSAEEAAAARAAEMPRWAALFEEIGPRTLDGKELEEPATAKTVRVRDGETLVTDGPFAETKEQLGGYYVIEVDSLEQAIEWAEKMPAMRNGAVEIRPLGEEG